VTDLQSTDSCPHCRNTTAVHSLGELAAMMRTQPSQPSFTRMIGQLTGEERAYTAPSQPQPGAATTTSPQPGYADDPQPGWAAEPQASGHNTYQDSRSSTGRPVFDPGMLTRALTESFTDTDSIEGAAAGAALGAAVNFLGRAFGPLAQQAYQEKVVPAMAQRQEAGLREQEAIAERYPELRACLTDQVFFLAGGTRVVPMPKAGMLTLEQSDALVAQLRQ
jgi:hypothetical protein